MANSTHLATVTATAWTTGSNGQQQQVHSGPGSILFLGIEVDFLFQFIDGEYMAGLYNCSSSWEFNGLASVCLLMQRTLAPPLLTIPWMQVLLAVRLPGGDDLWWNLFVNPSCRGNLGCCVIVPCCPSTAPCWSPASLQDEEAATTVQESQ